MNKIILSCISLLIALGGLSAETFEGMYKMSLSQGKDKMPMTIWTKDNHLRMEIKAQEMAGIMILRDGMESMLMLMPQQRMYMEMPIPQDGLESNSPSEPGEGEDFPFKKTGETKDILGYTAHEFVSEEGKDKLVIWATEELGSMPFARNPMMKGQANMMRKVTGLSSFFPLEMTNYKKGKAEFSMKVTEVKASELEDSLFEAPAGYMRMAMPGGMRGMMGR